MAAMKAGETCSLVPAAVKILLYGSGTELGSEPGPNVVVAPAGGQLGSYSSALYCRAWRSSPLIARTPWNGITDTNRLNSDKSARLLDRPLICDLRRKLS